MTKTRKMVSMDVKDDTKKKKGVVKVNVIKKTKPKRKTDDNSDNNENTEELANIYNLQFEDLT